MNDEQKAAYIRAQSVCAEIEMQGMLVKNAELSRDNIPPRWKQEDFDRVILKYGIHHNAVIGFFHNHGG